MAPFNNLMEILKVLPKTNCRQCHQKTCMAFAATVFKGENPLSLCPFVEPEVVRRHSHDAPVQRTNTLEQDVEKALQHLKEEIRHTDLAAAAGRVGGRYNSGKLTLKIMGKDFSVDTTGALSTDIHANPWITLPILNYILHCKGTPVAGEWVTMRELPSGKDWHHFFDHQCIKPLKKLADAYTDLFKDLVDLFNGKEVEHHYQSDVSVVLRPLPLVPMLVCYWQPEEGMDSDLNLFFDTSAEDNLGSGGLYRLGAGITRMFQKLALRHGVDTARTG